MSKVRQDVQSYHGRTAVLSFNVPGASMLSGAMKWRLGKTPGGAAVITKDENAGIAVIDDENCLVTIGAADWAAGLDPGLYFHALEQTLSGVVIQEASGRYVLRASPGV